MHPYLAKIIESKQIIDQFGTNHKLFIGISTEEGLFLQSVIKEIKPTISLEVGLAHGISAMFICESLLEVGSKKHIVIDPAQNSELYWEGLGLYNLSQCGYDNIIDFKNGKSEIVLPALLEQEEKIDFAFIDGIHTFDHALLDFFYINRMLNIGGVIVFDDANWKSINKAINYIKNYPSYIQYLPNSNSTYSNFKKPLTWQSINNKFKTEPYRLPYIILKYLNKDINFFLAEFNKKYQYLNNKYRRKYGIKNNIKIQNTYFAFQKISNDSRSYEWFIDF